MFAPAQNNVTSSEVVTSHLNSLQTSRKRFIETEAAEKLSRALRHKVWFIRMVIKPIITRMILDTGKVLK